MPGFVPDLFNGRAQTPKIPYQAKSDGGEAVALAAMDAGNVAEGVLKLVPPHFSPAMSEE